MENKFKRFLSLALAVLMLFTCIPFNAFETFAEENESVVSEVETQVVYIFPVGSASVDDTCYAYFYAGDGYSDEENPVGSSQLRPSEMTDPAGWPL